jgi:4-amino-4-deoxy-L-arabinose transferase-like glycosyltransferase
LNPGLARWNAFSPKLAAACLAVFCMALYLVGVHRLPLMDPDESRCALLAQGMEKTGDWLLPSLDGEPYYDKPAPYFWLTMAVTKLSGTVEFGGRFVSAVSATLAVLVAFGVARRLGGTAAGILAGIMLAMSPEFVFIARWYRMDMPFTAAMWAALAWFLRSEGGKDSRGKRWRWPGFYACCALATLMKGPVGLFLPAAVVGAYLLLCGNWRRVFELLHPGGFAIYLIVVAPFYVAVSLTHPRYAYEFFVVQHVLRFTSPEFGTHEKTGWLSIPAFLVGLMPWGIYIFGTAIRTLPVRWRKRNEHPEILFLWLAVLVPLTIFSFSSTVMAQYILPCLPPAAVLMGVVTAKWADSRAEDKLFRSGAEAMSIAMIVVIVVIGVAEFFINFWRMPDRPPVTKISWELISDVCRIAYGWWFAGLVVVAIAAAVLIGRASRMDNRPAVLAWASVALGAMLFFVVLHTFPSFYHARSLRELGLAARAAGADQPGAKLAFWSDRQYSFPLYAGGADAGRFVPDHPGEFDYLVVYMISRTPTYVLVSGEEELRRLQEACPGRVKVLKKHRGYWVVTNRF